MTTNGQKNTRGPAVVFQELKARLIKGNKSGRRTTLLAVVNVDVEKSVRATLKNTRTGQLPAWLSRQPHGLNRMSAAADSSVDFTEYFKLYVFDCGQPAVK